MSSKDVPKTDFNHVGTCLQTLIQKKEFPLHLTAVYSYEYVFIKSGIFQSYLFMLRYNCCLFKALFFRKQVHILIISFPYMEQQFVAAISPPN
jgi:hypothetical protein